MKKYFKPVLVLALVGIMFNACKKDDPASNTDNLCNKDWQMTAATINPAYDFGSGPVTDVYNDLFDPCDHDDYTNFNPSGTYIDYAGATKCDAADPDTSGGNWVWNSDETILIRTDYGSSPDSTTITKNDGTTLMGTQTFIESGITYTFTFTFKKKS